ncbi:hypothetical protein A3C32_02650 [Candidatus Daviesbacteria bacterium RIFCSPHIGHO2_02_FULL_41_14]|nr:MAG: hypothetical protein A3C32_02650 [Candidatus Daviesbacteria bacterium RIFCSPHIGHO2_02_FULL_41_14]
MVELYEPVNVWVLFAKTQPQPFAFIWKNRTIKVTAVNLIHTSREGKSPLYHYSISSGDNFYQLCFDTQNLKWHLEAVEEGE